MFLIMRFLGSVILFLFFTFSVHAKVKIITIGDSTMAEYDPLTTEKVGWGQTLSMFVLSDAATVILLFRKDYGMLRKQKYLREIMF